MMFCQTCLSGSRSSDSENHFCLFDESSAVGKSVPDWQKGRRRAAEKSFVGLRTGSVGIADRSRSSVTSLSLNHWGRVGRAS